MHIAKEVNDANMKLCLFIGLSIKVTSAIIFFKKESLRPCWHALDNFICLIMKYNDLTLWTHIYFKHSLQ